jgi:nitroreductase
MTPPNNYRTLLSILAERRSIRRYKQTPVPMETVERLIAAANLAPSASNRQPFRFLAVEDSATLANLADLVRKATSENAEKLPDDERAQVAKYTEFLVYFETAPVVLFAYHRADPSLAQHLGLSPDYDVGAIASVSAAIMNLLLAAHTLGLGACWMTGPLVAAPAMEKCLGLPTGWRLSAVIPVGIPDESPKPPKRRGADRLLTYFKAVP